MVEDSPWEEPGSTTIPAHGATGESGPRVEWISSEIAPSRYRGGALYIVEAALCCDRNRNIGNSISK